MRKILSVVLSFGLLFQQSGLVYAVGELNLANYLSQARSAIVQPDVFQPPRLRYISYDVANNDFRILLDKGNNVNQKTEKPKNEKTLESLNSSTPKLNDATQELFNYFLIGLALPNDTFWVNLRPDAPENIIDPLLEKTDIGKIFLEADLQLKKDTASLTSPQNPEGKAYWDKLYKKAGELFGTENITIPTITRPWIVPNEVIVRETEDSAYIYKATLKVMLESDYLIGRGGSRTAPTPDQYVFSDPRLKELNEYSTQLIRETIIPKLTKEINSSKRYAQLRQVYYSLVLARWFKQKYSSPGSASAPEPQSTSSLANSYISLIDSRNLANLNSQEPCDKQVYFQAYQKSFKDGEYNLKETVATPFGQSIRSYISGGLGMGFEYKAVNSPVTGIKVNSSPVTNVWTEQQAIVGSPLTLEEAANKLNSFFKEGNLYPQIISKRDMAAYYAATYGNLNHKDTDKILEAAKVVAGLLKEKGNSDAEEAKIYEELVKGLSEGFREFLNNKEGSGVQPSGLSVRDQSADPVTLGVVSSSLRIIQKPTNPLGGIDLTDRMLKIKLERVGSFALSALALPEITNVQALDLDKEYARIQAMASVSIRPSDTRILEFAAACYYRGEFDQRLAQVSSCIKAAHLADEISGRDSSEALRLATMLPDALYGG